LVQAMKRPFFPHLIAMGLPHLSQIVSVGMPLPLRLFMLPAAAWSSLANSA